MPSDLQQMALAHGRSPRLGEATDIAAMVAMLVSQDGEWVNGQTIHVEGGWAFSLKYRGRRGENPRGPA